MSFLVAPIPKMVEGPWKDLLFDGKKLILAMHTNDVYNNLIEGITLASDGSFTYMEYYPLYTMVALDV